MKIKLEFDGEDEMFKARIAIQSFDLWSALTDIDADLRHRYKHCSISASEEAFIEKLREMTMIVNDYDE